MRRRFTFHNSLPLGRNMLRYLSFICSSKPTVFLELRSRKAVCFPEQIMSADKYPSIFSRQIKAIVYIFSPQMEAIGFLSFKSLSRRGSTVEEYV